MKNFTGITADPREVKEGFIFVAIMGHKTNGEIFIDEAIENGAKKIIVNVDSHFKTDKNVIVEKVPNTLKHLAHLCGEFYSPQPKNIVGVTGTSGKTSTTSFFKQICELLNIKSASIGTLGVLSNEIEFDNSDVLTSPFPVELHKDLKKLADANVTHVGVEVSSHGLDQHRLDGIKFKAAAFTNLSQDHLDYHKDLKEYLNVKIRLFTELVEENGHAIINADTLESSEIIDAIKKYNPSLTIQTYGKNGNFIKLLEQNSNTASLVINNKNYDINHKLSGDFQIYNLMAATGLCLSLNIKIEDIIKITPSILPAPGRMEFVGKYNGAAIYVDYSHKPDALEKALLSLKPNCKGKLHLVFGCGGDRDPFKRPMMGKIASNNADVVYVTDDNPRTENAEFIRKAIISACPKALEIADRSECIKTAIKNLNPSDILLLAGKGNETYQIVGTTKHYFSDREEVLECLSNSID